MPIISRPLPADLESLLEAYLHAGKDDVESAKELSAKMLQALKKVRSVCLACGSVSYA